MTETTADTIYNDDNPDMSLGESSAGSGDWTDQLTLNKNGRACNTLYNMRLILENDEDFQGIVFNQLADDLEIRGSVPWNHTSKYWRDVDDAQLMCLVDERYGSFTQNNYRTALSKVTDDRSYHPVKDYFASLPEWDNVPRVDTLLIDYFSADDTPYVRAVTRKMLCAAVSRIYMPGIKFDHIMVLNGPQGIGKSTFISKLGMEWYSDSLSISDMNDKTAAEKLQGYWIHEIGELAGIRKADIDKVKAFISRQDDKYRASYGRRVSPHPRQCVFFGTTNAENGFLRDITGNRRFWAVRTPGAGVLKPWDLTQDDVDQIWAEALYLTSQGETLFLSHELEEAARVEQAAAMEHDDREGLVTDYLDLPLPVNWSDLSLYDRQDYVQSQGLLYSGGDVRLRDYVSNLEIWCECFGKDKADFQHKNSFEISAIMARIDGWEKTGKTMWLPIYGKQRVYRRKSETGPLEQTTERSPEQTI